MSFQFELIKDTFLTSDNVPVESRKTPYGFLKKLKEKPKSILTDYQTEIKNIFEKKVPSPNRADVLKIVKNGNHRLTDLNTVFEQLLITQNDESKYPIFAKLFTMYRSQNLHFIENALIYQKIIGSLPQNMVRNQNPIMYKNPIQFYNYQIEHNYILYKPLQEIIRKIHDDELREMTILGISNLYFANYINIRQPSIGPIYSIFENAPSINKSDVKSSIYSMLIHILNGNNHFNEHIPLKEMKIHKMISRLLVQKKKKSFNVELNASNVNFFSDEDERLMSMIENSIEGIQFTLNDVMKEDKKETSKVRSEYILPYRIKSTTPFEIEKLKELGSIEDRTDSQKILKQNRMLVSAILSRKETSFTNNPEQEEHIKNALAIYTYIAITLFYDVYKHYLNQISKILNDMVDDDRFRKLNIESGFDFIEKINQSLYMIKKIMENSFYHMYLPSKLTAKYGISIHKEKGFYQIENRLLAKLVNIYETFPFYMESSVESHPDRERRNVKNDISIGNIRVQSNFVNFMLSHKFKVDIYNPKEELFIGGMIMNEKKTVDIYKKYNEYFTLLYYVTIFNQIIGDSLLKALYVGIPIEVFRPVLNFVEANQYRIKDATYNQTFQDEIQKQMIGRYEEAVRKSTSYLLKLAEAEKDFEVLNEKKQEHMRQIEEYNVLSLLFYHISTVSFDIFSEEIGNEQFKLKMMTEMKKATKKYEKLLVEKTKNIQSEIKEHREELNTQKSNEPTPNQKPNSPNQNNKNQKNNKNESNLKKTNNVESYYQGLKRILNKEDIYIPYMDNGALRYLSVFTDKNANQITIRNTQIFVLAGTSQESISEKKVRLLKSSFVEKIQKVSSSDRRIFIREILSNPEIYENETEEVGDENPFISYMKEMNQKHGKEKSSHIFISEKQMQKISQMIQS